MLLSSNGKVVGPQWYRPTPGRKVPYLPEQQLARKTCAECRQTLPYSKFDIAPEAIDGVAALCRGCSDVV